MPEIYLHHHQHQQQKNQQQQQLLFHQSRPATNSRLGGMKGGFGGEIVEVQGGHIVRSTCRKDRHSKVWTAKGPKDRRVRLSAHTAIQFYDVQDRLGYDRPSMAVDWLIKNAKSAIDELADLPPWHPTATTVAAGATSDPSLEMDDSGGKGLPVHMGESAASSAFSFGGSSSFLPPSLESDAIADTIKFFFPIASGGGGGPSSITTASAPSSFIPTEFHQYPPDLLSRSNSHVQDLRLSLQSFQDPILLHQQHPPQQLSAVTEQSFFGNSSPTWSEQNERLLHWGGSNETCGGSITITAANDGNASSGSYMFKQMSQPQGVPLPLHPVLGQSPFLTQRGPLQSNNSPSILAWTDPAVAAMMSGSLSGFRIPARIQGEEEHEDDVGISRKPSSAPRR